MKSTTFLQVERVQSSLTLAREKYLCQKWL